MRDRQSYIPKNATLYKNETGLVVYFYEAAGACYAIGFRGKAVKPTFHYRFKGEAERVGYVEKQFVAAVELLALRAQRKAAVAPVEASLHYSIGDIVYNSWGYDQTNVEFYQVVGVKGCSIELREIAQNAKSIGWASAKVTPRIGEFLEKSQSFRKIVRANGYISFTYGCGTKWEQGQEVYSSSYA
jgi:hypothetical protein